MAFARRKQGLFPRCSVALVLRLDCSSLPGLLDRTSRGLRRSSVLRSTVPVVGRPQPSLTSELMLHLHSIYCHASHLRVCSIVVPSICGQPVRRQRLLSIRASMRQHHVRSAPFWQPWSGTGHQSTRRLQLPWYYRHIHPLLQGGSFEETEQVCYTVNDVTPEYTQVSHQRQVPTTVISKLEFLIH